MYKYRHQKVKRGEASHAATTGVWKWQRPAVCMIMFRHQISEQARNIKLPIKSFEYVAKFEYLAKYKKITFIKK
jgi:hypothetical protein